MATRKVKIQQRMLVERPEGGRAIRVFHRKAVGTRSARYLLKCGCCDKQVEIWYDDDELEINGVIGTVENWREILLPLLEPGGNVGAEQK